MFTSQKGLILGFALLMMLPAVRVSGSSLAESRNTVRTVLVFENPSWGGIEGGLKATFLSTRAADGTWDVEASFRPQRLKVLVYSQFGEPSQWVPVHGTASTTAIASTGEQVGFVASSLYYFHPEAGRFTLEVRGTFSVDASGVVTVSSISVS